MGFMYAPACCPLGTGLTACPVAAHPCAQNVRGGNYGVVASNHTLILNWNDQTVPLLRQIAINRRERADDTYDGCV